MHEMSYVIKIVNLALETVQNSERAQGAETGNETKERILDLSRRKSNGRSMRIQNSDGRGCRVRKVVVEVGEMTDIVPSYLCKYYPEAVKGTVLEQSELDVQVVPVQIRCRKCETRYHPDKEHRYSCPRCGSSDGEILSGRGMRLREVVVMEEE